MLTFIRLNSETKALYDHFLALTQKHFGDTPLPTKTFGTVTYTYPTINHLVQDRILKRGLGHLAEIESFPFNYDAEVSFSFMARTLHTLNLETYQGNNELLNDILSYWELFNACLSNNAAAAAFNARHDELTLPITTDGVLTELHLTSAHWREYVDPLLKKNHSWLNLVENQSKEKLMNSPQFLALFEDIALISQKNVMERNKEYTTISPMQLKEWVDTKNSRADKYQLESRQQILFNPDACFEFEIDRKVVFALRELMHKILQNQQPRTQVTFFVNKLTGYSLALDIAFVNGQFEIICADPSQSFSQHKLLEILTSILEGIKIPHRILATQGRLHPLGKHEDILGYLVMQQLKHASFNSIEPQARLTQPQFCLPTEPDILGTAPKLPNSVRWFDFSLLGAKVALLDGERPHMIARLKNIYPKTHEVELKRFTQWYQLDITTYLEGRRKRLFYRINGINQSNASIEVIKQGMEVGSDESDGKALRRTAAFGPSHYLESLCKQLVDLTLNEVDATSSRSALHWSFIKNKPTRAIRLLEQGIDTTLSDSKGKTAKDYALESENADCRAVGKSIY